MPPGRVGFDAPPGGRGQTSQDAQENRQRIRLSDPEMTRYIRERARLPKMVFTKHPIDYPAMNPTFQVYTAPPGLKAAAVLQSTLQQFKAMPGFKLAEQRAVPLPGRDAVMMHATFPLTNTVNEQTQTVEAHMLIVSDGTETAVFGFSGPAEGNDRCDSEFRRFLASVKPLANR